MQITQVTFLLYCSEDMKTGMWNCGELFSLSLVDYAAFFLCISCISEHLLYTSHTLPCTCYTCFMACAIYCHELFIHCHALAIHYQALVIHCQAVTTEEEYLPLATIRIAHLCAYNVVLWQIFTDICSYNTRVIKVMAKEYHQSRVCLFSGHLHVCHLL